MSRRLVLAAFAVLSSSALFVSGAGEAAPARDPKIMALANAAAKCKFEDEYFDNECKAYTAWTDEEKLFEDNKGDATLLSMLEDPDLKLRTLAVAKGIPAAAFSTKPLVEKLLALGKTEKSKVILHDLGSLSARVDLEKHGLVGKLAELAAHPEASFRDPFAFHVYADKQTPERLAIVKVLVTDKDAKVRKSAYTTLSMGAQRAKDNTEACKLMGAQLDKTDETHGDMLWSAGSSKCMSIYETLGSTLVKRAADLALVEKHGVSYSLSISFMCSNGGAKAKGFVAAKMLTDAKVKNSNVRAAAVDCLASCDPVAAKPVLAALAKDKEKYVAERATKELAKLK